MVDISPLNVWCNTPVKPSGPGFSFVRRFLITDSVSLIVLALTWCRTSVFQLWATLKSHLPCHLKCRPEQYSKVWNMLSLEPEESFSELCSLLGSGRCEMQWFVLYSQGHMLACLNWTPKTSLMCFVRFTSNTLEHMYLTKGPNVLSIS